MRSSRVFDWCIRILLVLLPWMIVLSVFFTYKVGIPGFSFLKEGLLSVAGVSLIMSYIASRHTPGAPRFRLTLLDILIAIYILYMVGITFVTTGLPGLIYGGRYDFSFLLTFLVAYHGAPFLEKPVSYYLRLFLISTGITLFIGGLLKWPFSSDLLLYVGYSGNPSSWDFTGAPPIFQGIDGANVRRFQGLMDGPNSMGAFLILSTGVFAYYMRYKKNWFFASGLIIAGLIGMIFYTYSRSALIGIMVAILLVTLMSLGMLYRLYRVQLLSVLLVFAVVIALIVTQYSTKLQTIVTRDGSTKGHMERLTNGYERFRSAPFGQGLGSAGPAYRYVYHLQGLTAAETVIKDEYYIPESWYVQQFIEGGVVGGVVFLLIMLILFWQLLMTSPVLGGLFAGIGMMNLFLHTFESSVVSLSLFLLMGLILGYGKHHGKK